MPKARSKEEEDDTKDDKARSWIIVLNDLNFFSTVPQQSQQLNNNIKRSPPQPNNAQG